MCADGSLPAAGLSFDGESCQDIAQDVKFERAQSGVCAEAQAIGFAFCGCPAPDDVTETCNICGEEGLVLEPDVVIDDEVTDVVFNCGSLANIPNFFEGFCGLLEGLDEICCTEPLGGPPTAPSTPVVVPPTAPSAPAVAPQAAPSAPVVGPLETSSPTIAPALPPGDRGGLAPSGSSSVFSWIGCVVCALVSLVAASDFVSVG